MANIFTKIINPKSLSHYQLWQVNTYGYYLGKNDSRIYPKWADDRPISSGCEDLTDQSKQDGEDHELEAVNNFFEHENNNHYE